MKEYKSKVDLIYERLLNDILTNVYAAGDRLVINQIAKQTHVSDIPIREALRRLESQGYVQINANQGAVVHGIAPSDLIAIFQIKGVLEGYAARLSIDYLTPKDIRKMRSINEQFRKACQEKNAAKCSQLNMDFHLTNYSVIPQKPLYELIVDLWKKWSITKTVFSAAPQRMEDTCQEHDEIICLLEAKEYDKVEQFVRSHKITAGEQWEKQERERANAEQKDNCGGLVYAATSISDSPDKD